MVFHGAHTCRTCACTFSSMKKCIGILEVEGITKDVSVLIRNPQALGGQPQIHFHHQSSVPLVVVKVTTIYSSPYCYLNFLEGASFATLLLCTFATT